jgi:hypothetical protein
MMFLIKGNFARKLFIELLRKQTFLCENEKFAKQHNMSQQRKFFVTTKTF